MNPISTEPPFHEARIARLVVYPVKSCAGIELQEALLTETGLDLDRAWMVVDDEGEFVSQRELPRLALVQPAFRRGGTELTLRAPGMLALHLAVDVVEEPVRVRVWDDNVDAYDMGDVAAQWFTDFLSLNEAGLPRAGAPRYRLVRCDPEHPRQSDPAWTEGVAALNQFSDGFALLVLGQASLDALAERVDSLYGPVSAARFRPNIVLDQLPAHAEDQARLLRVPAADAEAQLQLVKPCVRCQVPDIDPVTGLHDGAVNPVLQTYRQDARFKGGVTFGMNAIVREGAGMVLRVGQPVWVS